jgi:hypothetical protein
MKTGSLVIGLCCVKVMRIILCYIALFIAQNYTSQVYMDKVLVNNENPPRLSNLVFLTAIIEAVMMVIFIGLLYITDSQFKVGLGGSFFTEYVLPDYFLGTFFIVLYGLVVASKMYSKKYFLYKEDGMRAIRALTDILFSITCITTFVHWNIFVFGIINLVQK